MIYIVYFVGRAYFVKFLMVINIFLLIGLMCVYKKEDICALF